MAPVGQVAPRALRVLLVLATLTACDRAPTALTPTRITVLEGNNTIATAGSWITMSARVTDNSDHGVPNVPVHWQVSSGAGEFSVDRSAPTSQLSTVTRADGITSVLVRLTAVGTSVVTASIGGPQGAPVNFTTTVIQPADVVIRFGPLFDCPEPSMYTVAGKSVTNVVVSVGAKVEWVYGDWVHHTCTARITSSSVPAGGQPFDSGIMHPGGFFQFVFNAPGTWHFTDALNGGTGTVTVLGTQ